MATKKIEIPCPRCQGRGSQIYWHPDFGICYRCKGKGFVKFDLDAHKRALVFLRNKWLNLKRKLRYVKDEREIEYINESLRFTEQDGIRVREEIDYVERFLMLGEL